MEPVVAYSSASTGSNSASRLEAEAFPREVSSAKVTREADFVRRGFCPLHIEKPMALGKGMVNQGALDKTDTLLGALAWSCRKFPQDKNFRSNRRFLDTVHELCIELEMLPGALPKALSFSDIERVDLVVEHSSKHVNARDIASIVEPLGDVN